MNKESVLNFISDLVCPIDPMVFAGYGTKYQNDIDKGFNEGDFGQIIAVEEKFISDFLDSADLIELLDIMIDIFVKKPIGFSNNLPIRRADDWDYSVTLVISNIANRMPEKTIEKLNDILKRYKDRRKDIIEILTFMDYRISYKKLMEIKEYYGDLSNSELEMIKEIEDEYNRFLNKKE